MRLQKSVTSVHNDLVINNLTFINSGAIFQSWSNYNIVMKGTFNYYGTFDFTQNSNTGSVIFDGSTQGINNYSSGSGIFNNVVFSSSTGTSVASGDLVIAKNLPSTRGISIQVQSVLLSVETGRRPLDLQDIFRVQGLFYFIVRQQPPGCKWNQ